MGFRFRRSFKAFPGCRINIGKRGFSVSVGGRGSTFNISRRGVRATVGIPGTGISYSGYISKAGGGGSGRRRSCASRQSLLSGSGAPLPAFQGESIESAPIGELNSDGLQGFHDLIAKARDDRKAANEMLKETEAEITGKESELERRKRSLFRFFFKKRIAALGDALIELADKKRQLEDILAGLHIDMNFNGFEHTMQPYIEMEDAFIGMMGCSRIWDVTAFLEEEKGRTTASQTLARKAVSFTPFADDVLKFEKSAMRFQNANGGDIIIYPGFAIIQESDSKFAIIDLRDLSIEARECQLMEDQGVPADSEIIEHRWLKANKDGSPDKRFRANREIPVCRYGELNITSGTGICERYLLSRMDAAANFATAFASYVNALDKNADD